MMTLAPGAPTPGEKSSMTGAGPMARKVSVETTVPAGLITVMGPLVALAGTVARICVGAVIVKAAGRLLNSTLVTPTKLNPSMVTGVLVAARAGEKSVMRGAIRKTPLLAPEPDGLVT